MDRNDVIEKVFPHSLFGYDPVAVDAFLDEVIREFDRLANTIDVLQFRLANGLVDDIRQDGGVYEDQEHGEYAGRPKELGAAPEEAEIQPADADEEAAQEAAEPAAEPEAEQPDIEDVYADGAREE